MLENRIQNEIAKRIDKAHNYSFNLANYKSTLSKSQITDWKNALKHIEPNRATTLDEVYKKLNNCSPESALPYLKKLNPSNALEADIAREYISNIKENIALENKELYSIKKIIKSKQKYPFEKLEDKIKPKYIKIKKTDYNGDIDIVQKISFKDGKIHFRDEKSTGMDLYKAEKGDLITSKINVHQGALALADRNLVCSTHYQVYEIDKNLINPNYLAHILRSNWFQIRVNEIKNGGIKNEQGADFLMSLEIPLPSIEEQNDIVDQIEKQKAIIEGVEKVIGNWVIDFDLYFSSFNFSQKSLSELITESLYGSSQKADYQEEGYKVLRIGNIGFCDFKLNDIKKSVLPEKDYKKYKLRKGDFLIVRSNGNPKLVGKCAVWDSNESYIYASYLIRFRFDLSNVDPKYVMYFFMSPSGRKLLNPQAGGGTYNISATEFKKVQIPFPEIEIQRKIIAEIDAQMKILDGLQKMKSEAERKIEKILADVWGEEAEEPIKMEAKHE